MSVTPMQQIPVVQMGHVEKIVEVVQNQPHVLQQVAQETAKNELRQQAGQVPQVNKSEAAHEIRTEADGQNKQQAAGGQQHKEKDNQPDDQEEPPRGENPWAGHIVNLKI